MLPIHAMDNFPNCIRRHSESLTESRCGYGATGIQGANFDNLVCCQSVKRIGLASKHGVSSLRSSIAIVCRVISEKKVRWPNTPPIVAKMENKLVSEEPESQQPRRSMRENHRIVTHPDSPVPVFAQVAAPNPAASKLRAVGRYRTVKIDLCPEPLYEGGRKTLRREKVSPIVGPLDQLHRCLIGSRSRRLRARGHFVGGMIS